MPPDSEETPAMRLYRTRKGIVAEDTGRAGLLKDKDWDALFNRKGLAAYLARALKASPPMKFDPDKAPLLAPIGSQEVWAAGVTYFRSRDARIEESKAAGGGDFYARVYEADRPEIFFKSTPHRVAGPRQPVRIRKDSKWNVPEPELAVVVNAAGRIIGWTICNDMSSRDIEGENPLYLPQAKVYDQSCALGPCILVSEQMPPPETEIRIDILRGGCRSGSRSRGAASARRPGCRGRARSSGRRPSPAEDTGDSPPRCRASSCRCRSSSR